MFDPISCNLAKNKVPLLPCGLELFRDSNSLRGGCETLEFLYDLKFIHYRPVRDRTASCALGETFDKSHGKAKEERDIGLDAQASRATYGFETPLIVP